MIQSELARNFQPSPQRRRVVSSPSVSPAAPEGKRGISSTSWVRSMHREWATPVPELPLDRPLFRYTGAYDVFGSLVTAPVTGQSGSLSNKTDFD